MSYDYGRFFIIFPQRFLITHIHLEDAAKAYSKPALTKRRELLTQRPVCKHPWPTFQITSPNGPHIRCANVACMN